jgi:transglutaminase/protease-like cytokinesis protein 3
VKHLAPVIAAVLLLSACKSFPVTERGTYQLSASYEEADSFRTGRIDPFVNTIIESPQFSGYSRRDPIEYINLVAYHIKSNTKNEFERIKRVHDFVIAYLTYDTKMHRTSSRSFFPARIKRQDAISVVRSRLAVGVGYANLFQALCEAMGQNSEIVNGYARDEKFSPFNKNEYYQRPGHRWNIVQANDCWYVVDTAWDAGYVEKINKKETFVKAYTNEWLFTNPQYFVYTHLPLNLNHELLEYLIHPDDFTQLPYIRPVYFDNVIQLSPALNKQYEVGAGILSLSYVLSDNQNLDFLVLDKKSKKDISANTKYVEKKQTKRNTTQFYGNKKGS